MHLTDSNSVSRIQAVDGGFFEKFGSLFREQAEFASAQEQIEKQRVAKAAEQIIPEKTEEDGENETPPTIDSDASSLSSDSENEGEKEATDLIATALNVSNFFNSRKHVIFHTTHLVGSFPCFLCSKSFEN